MIPKIIHYCWFGRNPLPKSAIKCINSWKKFFPDYEIKEWNEDNFDINIIPYTKEAYEAKKYAFVSDFARFWILYKYGGLYFDTDVEVIKPMDDIVANGSFFGIEVDGDESRNILPTVAPGLCLGAESRMDFYKQILDGFGGLNYYLPDGSRNTFTMIPMIREMLINKGLQANNKIQKVDEFLLYPSEYFNPLDSITGVLNLTGNTRSIHWYSATWMDGKSRFAMKVKRLCRRLINILRLKK